MPCLHFSTLLDFGRPFILSLAHCGQCDIFSRGKCCIAIFMGLLNMHVGGNMYSDRGCWLEIVSSISLLSLFGHFNLSVVFSLL